MSGELDALGGEILATAVHNGGAEGEEDDGHDDGEEVADMEIDGRFADGGEVAGLFMAGKHPEGGPCGEVNGGGHPAQKHDEETDSGEVPWAWGGKVCRGDGSFEEGEGEGGDGGDGEKDDDNFGEGVEEAVMAEEDGDAAEEEEDCGELGEGEGVDAESGEKGGAQHGDAGDIDNAGEDIDEEEDDQVSGALVSIALEEGFSGGGGIALAVEEKREFEEIGEEHEAEQLVAEQGTGAGGPDQVGAADGGTGDEDSGADGFPERFGVGGGGWHGQPVLGWKPKGQPVFRGLAVAGKELVEENCLMKTLVIGASERSSRYAHQAVCLLREHQEEVVATGIRAGRIGEVVIETGQPAYTDVDTVTLYIGPPRQDEALRRYVIGLNPRRVIFNPGTENALFAEELAGAGIAAVEACTLVMLRTGQW